MSQNSEMVKQHLAEENKDVHENIPQDIMEEATELCRGAEVLPDGALGLACRIYQARKQGRPLRAKLGVDPTAADLHIGHAVVLRKLRRFQDFGHQVVLIIGGFTARIGDPTGRNATRPPLTAEDVTRNAETYLSQIELILDLSKVEMTNNADWLDPLSLKDVIKLASTVTANQLLAKEAFGSRLEQQQPVALHELFYPLLQAYDSVAIRADVELGGTDQRFNILQGRELQPCYEQEAQMAMLLPLLEGTDGVKKMSKTYNNYIALKDTPDDMFGKCMRIPDELIIKFYDLASSFTGKEIDQVKEMLEKGGNPKDAKEKLGKQLVLQYHGEAAAEVALATWKKVHSEKQVPDDMPSHTVIEPTALFRIMVDAKLCAGSGEAKRLVQEGGVRINGEQVKDPNQQVSVENGPELVLQVGRRKFVKLLFSSSPKG
ncbi:MAG: tyrosine--tRNA ligase [Candidatus Melainabacteria bacterium]|nr:tyrosine--tRNA ligase [Candidatus Melainabacteria bacterium]